MRHAKDGMINLQRKRCITQGCVLTANFGFGRELTHCHTHGEDGMTSPRGQVIAIPCVPADASVVKSATAVAPAIEARVAPTSSGVVVRRAKVAYAQTIGSSGGDGSDGGRETTSPGIPALMVEQEGEEYNRENVVLMQAPEVGESDSSAQPAIEFSSATEDVVQQPVEEESAAAENVVQPAAEEGSSTAKNVVQLPAPVEGPAPTPATALPASAAVPVSAMSVGTEGEAAAADAPAGGDVSVSPPTNLDVLANACEAEDTRRTRGGSSASGCGGSENVRVGGDLDVVVQTAVETDASEAVPMSSEIAGAAPRRSTRVPGSSALNSPCLIDLLDRIRRDDGQVEVLRLSNYIGPDASTAAIDAVLQTLMFNNKCQALYIQNFSQGFRDEQVSKLVNVLRRGNIWCLNAGENYNVKPSTWRAFVKEIENTNVTVSARTGRYCVWCVCVRGDHGY